MKKILLIFILLMVCMMQLKAQPVYLATGGKCNFHSYTPVEDIDANSESLNSVLNTSTNDIQFKVPLTSFRFAKALMQEHFNEKYVESDKYPFATFKGKINETIDFTKDGVYEITATGIFNIHNADKLHTEKGTLTIKNGILTIEGAFKVALKDHKIEVPKIVIANIAEIIDVKYSCKYSTYQKK
jgi:hypothetical protein